MTIHYYIQLPEVLGNVRRNNILQDNWLSESSLIIESEDNKMQFLLKVIYQPIILHLL